MLMRSPEPYGALLSDGVALGEGSEDIRVAEQEGFINACLGFMGGMSTTSTSTTSTTSTTSSSSIITGGDSAQHDSETVRDDEENLCIVCFNKVSI